jgi:hypothetical protein
LSNPGDADAISRILPPQQAKDFVAWHLEKTGIFTVRSGHNLALKLEQAPNMQSTSTLAVHLMEPDDFGKLEQCLEQQYSSEGQNIHMEACPSCHLDTEEQIPKKCGR